MPTYVCTTRTGRLSKEDREDLVNLITTAHAEETGAPRYLVQVIFQEVGEGCYYIAGEVAPAGQMWIRADIRSGRTIEQKRQILTRLLKGASWITNVAEEEVWVYLSDVPASNIAEFGRVLPEPGEEEAWLGSLPQALKKSGLLRWPRHPHRRLKGLERLLRCFGVTERRPLPNVAPA